MRDHRRCSGAARLSIDCVDMARVPDADISQLDRSIKAVLEAQAKRWGAPLLNHLIYARRPSIFKGARMMWNGLDASGLIDGRLAALINRRVAHGHPWTTTDRMTAWSARRDGGGQLVCVEASDG